MDEFEVVGPARDPLLRAGWSAVSGEVVVLRGNIDDPIMDAGGDGVPLTTVLSRLFAGHGYSTAILLPDGRLGEMPADPAAVQPDRQWRRDQGKLMAELVD